MIRKTKTRQICLMALFAAIAVVVMYISSILPSGRLAFPALTGIVMLASVIEGGIGGSISVFVVSSVLALLFSSDKVPILIYIIFFGYYPILKSLIERIKNLSLEWLLKILLVNIVITVIIFLLKGFIVIDFKYEFLNNKWVLYIIANIAFAIYDLALSRLASIYISRVYKKK